MGLFKHNHILFVHLAVGCAKYITCTLHCCSEIHDISIGATASEWLC